MWILLYYYNRMYDFRKNVVRLPTYFLLATTKQNNKIIRSTLTTNMAKENASLEFRLKKR